MAIGFFELRMYFLIREWRWFLICLAPDMIVSSLFVSQLISPNVQEYSYHGYKDLNKQAALGRAPCSVKQAVLISQFSAATPSHSCL